VEGAGGAGGVRIDLEQFILVRAGCQGFCLSLFFGSRMAIDMWLGLAAGMIRSTLLK
jgi:hypothetical protein